MTIESLRPGEADCQLCLRNEMRSCPIRGLKRFDELVDAGVHECASFRPIGQKALLKRRYASEVAPEQPGLF